MYGFSLKDMCQLMIDADVVIARVGNVERGNEEWNGNDMTGNGNAARNISIITCDVENFAGYYYHARIRKNILNNHKDSKLTMSNHKLLIRTKSDYLINNTNKHRIP